MDANCKLQRRACWAKPLFGPTIYLFGGSRYPTLGCPRLRDPTESFFSLSQFYPLSISLTPFFFSELHPLTIHSFLLFIAFVNGVIIIIFSLSVKKGPMSMGLSGFLGTSGFGNGSRFS